MPLPREPPQARLSRTPVCCVDFLRSDGDVGDVVLVFVVAVIVNLPLDLLARTRHVPGRRGVIPLPEPAGG
jgi:hypothetical protein